MVQLLIDGRELKAEEGKTILDAARDANIYIPTLCHNDEVSPYGSCRLCMVEITRRGKKRLVASCLFPVEEGLVVSTMSPRVGRVRRLVMELLLARCPDSEVLKELGARLGVEKTSFPLEEGHNKCILCGLCTRVCEEVVGVSAISMASRGTTRQMATPFNEFSEACIACGSCAYVCPTRAITVEDVGGIRRITMPNTSMEFPLAQCTQCGRYWAPRKQLTYIAKRAGLPADAFDLCPDCREL
jgi:bidirectional [NiFe] hydrogenase diaphorase subunit